MGCLGKSITILIILAAMYVCCKWPQEVVWVLEFGFRFFGMLFDAVVEAVRGVSAAG